MTIGNSRNLFLGVLGISSIFLAASGIQAQTFVPNNDNFVVETLPRAIVSLSQELRESRDKKSEENKPFTSDPNYLLLIERDALFAYKIASESQDQRAYGHTMAILKRWPKNQEKSTTIHMLTAAVLQHSHQFSEALTHLSRASELSPNNAQVLLMQTQISLVTADYIGARQYCNALIPLVRHATAVNCQAQVDGLTGNAQAGLLGLENTLKNNRDLSVEDYLELFISTADIAHRLGQNTLAENAYIAALQLAPQHQYLLTQYANFLLEQGRNVATIALLDSQDSNRITDEQRILLAQSLLNTSQTENISRAEMLMETLQVNFEAAQQRGESIPNKALAQYSLHVDHDPESALKYASRNWALQKEPSDTLLFAQSALALKETNSLRMLEVWVNSNGMEDVRLEKVLASQRNTL